MIKSMTVRPAVCHRFAQRILSAVTVTSRKSGTHYGDHSMQLAAFRPIGIRRNGLSLYRASSTLNTPNLADSRRQGTKQYNNKSFGSHGISCTTNRQGSSDASKATTGDQGSLEKKSFRYMMRQYGGVFFGTYFAVYCSTVFGLFLSVQSGHLDVMYVISLLTGTSSPTDPGGVADPGTIEEAQSTVKFLVEFLESYSMTKPVAPMVEEYPWVGNFAIAWIATKFTEPIRFGATVALTPSLARFFGYKRVSPAVRNAGPIDIVSSKQKDTPP
mmetsp:Transcript_26828/g.62707  ORF Transcript_26828/g.62707 Transcript_26828/m.62707 type:complete len:272 (-) Transcript_26828:210-1025(-)